jgi:hypothetical protein
MPDRPDPLTDALARFTPTTRLDRDVLLFRAGRASAPKPRWWKRATALLLVTQAATLAVWLRPTPEPSPPPPHEAVPAEGLSPDHDPAPLPPASYGALARAVEENGLPPLTPTPGETPDGPTLSVMSARHGLTLD